MNVMIYNKYKDLLIKLNIDTIKKMEGVFNVDELIDAFSNFYYDKMILDITAIRDYQNMDNLQKLAMNINMDNVILLLDNNPESESKSYLSKLVSLGIYNFTRNSEGINYLLVNPHTYKDVANLDSLDDINFQTNNHNIKNENVPNEVNTSSNEKEVKEQFVSYNNNSKQISNDYEKENDTYKENISNANLKIIGFKNATNHAGATTLIYMIKKALSNKKIACIEVNKVDFLFFNDTELISTTIVDLPIKISENVNCDYIFIDLNDCDDTSICNEIYYLIEPSTIMINKMLKRNKNILEELKDKNVILNKCVLDSNDVHEFEYETKLKVLYSIPPCDDRRENISEIEKFVNKIIL